MDLIADRKYSGLRLGEINMDAGVDGNSGSFRLEADSESLSDDPGIGASDEEKGSETPRAASPRSRPHAKAEMKDLDHKRKSRGRRRKLSKLDIAYVQREDVHFGDFTVAQNLYFSALLRLGCGLSETELRSRCEEAAAAVGLSGAMDVKVGTELIKGISGGEKKRLSIATELLAFPAVICLDEPTTGA
jgi:ABC-type glutathione transport system ATPase component